MYQQAFEAIVKTVYGKVDGETATRTLTSTRRFKQWYTPGQQPRNRGRRKQEASPERSQTGRVSGNCHGAARVCLSPSNASMMRNKHCCRQRVAVIRADGTMCACREEGSGRRAWLSINVSRCKQPHGWTGTNGIGDPASLASGDSCVG